MTIIPKTTTRVESSTEPRVNERIRRQAQARVARFRGAPRERVLKRLEELDCEWDIERTLEANAAAVSLLGLWLGRRVDRRWYALPAVAAAFLLQHAVQGWCPAAEWFRRLGVRTPREIDEERRALEGLAGLQPERRL